VHALHRLDAATELRAGQPDVIAITQSNGVIGRYRWYAVPRIERHAWPQISECVLRTGQIRKAITKYFVPLLWLFSSSILI
jgi:hypothetical protein